MARLLLRMPTTGTPVPVRSPPAREDRPRNTCIDSATSGGISEEDHFHRAVAKAGVEALSSLSGTVLR